MGMTIISLSDLFWELCERMHLMYLAFGEPSEVYERLLLISGDFGIHGGGFSLDLTDLGG